LVTAAMMSLGVMANGRVSDEDCRAGACSLGGSAEYAVVSPVGVSTVKPIQQAPRLSTLEGKTIAVVGDNFMARVTHAELKRTILAEFPSAKVILRDEIGSAGLYPQPGVVRRAKDEFQRKLKEMKVDAVISGNGGCGLCTPKETGSCIAAEYIGIPSVIIAGPGFVKQAKQTAWNNGVPVLRTAEYPGAFAVHTEAELIRNTREVLWPRILSALTQPITNEERKAQSSGDADSVRQEVFRGNFERVQAYFKEMKWTDGLPIVPPTITKVKAFLEFTPHKWDETIAVLPIANRDTKNWHVAVNGVMAGCKPEHMPILVAMTKCFGVRIFNYTLGSTHGWMPYAWLNGPIARQLGFDCGQGQVNEEANVALGRFINLAMMNLCGFYVKQDRMGTFGYPMPWSLAEDEAACLRVGWEPYHVRKGFGLNDNAITVSSALLWGNNMAPSTPDARKLAELMAWDISERGQFALGSGKQFVPRTILMTEPVAAVLSKRYRSVGELESELVNLARRPVRERVLARYYANPGGSREGATHNIKELSGFIRRSEGAQMTPTAPWSDSPEAEQLTIPTMKTGMTDFVVTGDASRNKVQIMPGGGNATIRIELPRDWSKRMADLGYKPLESFYLEK